MLVTGGFAVIDWGAVQAPLERAVAAQRKPNVLVIESDDQTAESMRVMQNVNSPDRRSGRDVHQQLRQLLALLPVAVHLPHRAVRTQSWGAGQPPPEGGFQRFESLHGDNNLAVWLKSAGYYTGLIGKYLNGYENDPAVPPGWSDWHATAPATQKVYNYTLNNNGNWSTTARLPRTSSRTC